MSAESSAICDSCWAPLDEMDLFEIEAIEPTDYVICSECMDAESQG